MKIINKGEAPTQKLQGRYATRIVGKTDDYYYHSDTLHFGHCLFRGDTGPMTPHAHAEECMYILDCKDAWILSGPSQDDMPDRAELEPGMVISMPAAEWHVFRYKEGGFVEILYCYGDTTEL